MSIPDRIKRAAALTLRAVEFDYYHVFISMVDRVTRLPRNAMVPETMRFYRAAAKDDMCLDLQRRRRRIDARRRGAHFDYSKALIEISI